MDCGMKNKEMGREWKRRKREDMRRVSSDENATKNCTQCIEYTGTGATHLSHVPPICGAVHEQ